MLTLLDIFLVSPDLLMAFDSVDHSSPLASLLAASWSSSYFRGSCYSGLCWFHQLLPSLKYGASLGSALGPHSPHAVLGGFSILQLQCPFAGSPHILCPAEILFLMSRAVIPADL